MDKVIKPEFARWFFDKGDETHRLNYNLNRNSIVLDIGGYMGDWSNLIYKKYKCHILIFEPVTDYYNEIVHRFKDIPKIKVFNFALEGQDRGDVIKSSNDGTSLYIASGREIKISVKDVLNIQYLKHIDLIKINIEGSEYPLLERIIETGLIKKIDNIQVQFHLFADKTGEKRSALQSKLSITHELTYNYEFVWENWKRK